MNSGKENGVKESGANNELLTNINRTVSNVAETVRHFGIHRPRTANTPASPVTDLCVPSALCSMVTMGDCSNCVPVPLADLLANGNGNKVAILHCEAKNPNSNKIIPHAVGAFRIGDLTGIFDPTYSQINGARGKPYHVSLGDIFDIVQRKYGSANSLNKHLELSRLLNSRSGESKETQEQVCAAVGITAKEANILDEKLQHLDIPSMWWGDCIPGGFMAKYGHDWSSFGVSPELAQKIHRFNVIAVDGLRNEYTLLYDRKGRSRPNTYVSQDRSDLSREQLDMLEKWLQVSNRSEGNAVGTIYKS